MFLPTITRLNDYLVFLYVSIRHICFFRIIKMRVALHHRNNVSHIFVVKIICNVADFLFYLYKIQLIILLFSSNKSTTD